MASEHEHLISIIEQAAGPVRWASDGSGVDTSTGTGHHRGWPIWFAPHRVRVGSSGDGNTVLRGTTIAVDLGGREIALTIDRRDRTGRTRPEVLTGDGIFDHRFLVQGWPEAAGRTGLSPSVREWIFTTWPDGWPSIRAENGTLEVDVTVFPRSGPWATADALRLAVDRTVELAGGLVAGYDQARAAAVATGGEAAGAAWDTDLGAKRDARRRNRLVARLVAFSLLATIVVGTLGIIAASIS